MSIGQDIESEFIATPEQSLEEPVQPVEIHEEELHWPDSYLRLVEMLFKSILARILLAEDRLIK